jgi:hypothetical protein
MISSTSSSSDDDPVEPNICVTGVADDGTCSIYSNNCPDGFVPKFGQGSFAIHNTKMVIHVELNPMFAWRLLHTIPSDRMIDDVRIRTRASFDMATNPIRFVLHLCSFKTPTPWAVMSEEGDADCALKTHNCMPKTHPKYLLVLDAFNQLYADRYNTPDRTRKMTDAIKEIMIHAYGVGASGVL